MTKTVPVHEYISVSDPHSLFADPDPDPAVLTNADPDPISDPDPGRLKVGKFFRK
jgi:hypothetical protein